MSKPFEIIPLLRIGPIALGATRADVRAEMAALGFPLESMRDTQDYFCESCVQVEYGADDCADFIGIGSAAPFPVLYEGIDVFDVSAMDLFSRIAKNEAAGPHRFTNSEYLFPDQIIALWEADEQYDQRGAMSRSIWGQVAIGNARYLQAIRAIEAGGILPD
jgi:hypothetical protein